METLQLEIVFVVIAVLSIIAFTYFKRKKSGANKPNITYPPRNNNQPPIDTFEK